jgi:hypothetical protein
MGTLTADSGLGSSVWLVHVAQLPSLQPPVQHANRVAGAIKNRQNASAGLGVVVQDRTKSRLVCQTGDGRGFSSRNFADDGRHVGRVFVPFRIGRGLLAAAASW